MHIRFPTLGVLAVFTLAAGADATRAQPITASAPDAAEETVALAELEEELVRAALELDAERLRRGLASAQATLADVGDDGPAAGAAYLAAFAGFQLLSATFGQLDDVQEVVSGVRANLDRAFQEDPERLETHLLSAMVRAAGLPPLQAVEAAEEPLESARELAPGDPRIDVATAIASLFTGQARGPLEEAVSKLDGEDVRGTDLLWWHSQALAFLADDCLGSFGGERDEACARRAVARALELYPRNRYVRDIVEPWLAEHSPAAAPPIAADAWKVVAEDPSGDGQVSGAPDARALHWALVPSGEWIWFRFAFHGEARLGADGFGVNLFLDTDGDPETGHSWIGKNRQARFDRVVSVYLRPRGERFVGVAGVTSGDDFWRRRLTAEAHDVRFSLDREAGVLLIGVRREVVGRSATVLGAVGRPNRFSDDLPDSGLARLVP